MLLQILKSKIQQLVVTESSIEYPGSISLPKSLLKAAGIKHFELVYVNNKTNGNRIVTYAVQNKSEKEVTVNGAASKLFNKGDIIHVLSFAYFDEAEADEHKPTIVIADHNNQVIETKIYEFV
jgi:aspartate 1-decarboxylase